MSPENLFVQRLGPGLDRGGPVRLRRQFEGAVAHPGFEWVSSARVYPHASIQHLTNVRFTCFRSCDT